MAAPARRAVGRRRIPCRRPRAFSVLLGLALAACGASPSAPEPGTVPWLADGLFLAPPVVSGGPLLLCGRFEVTREDFLGTGGDVAAADLPATFLSREEAASWARERGLRLPSLAEWRHLAAGGAAFPLPAYPWGGAFLPARANTLEEGLHRPLPVGVFELGRNSLGAYDFAGNVWEWVADSPDGEPDLGLACGGSFAASGERASLLEGRLLAVGDRAEDLGFRVAADALSWIQERVVPVWNADEGADREHLRGAFRRWRPDLARLLADRLEAAGAPGSLCEALREPQ